MQKYGQMRWTRFEIEEIGKRPLGIQLKILNKNLSKICQIKFFLRVPAFPHRFLPPPLESHPPDQALWNATHQPGSTINTMFVSTREQWPSSDGCFFQSTFAFLPTSQHNKTSSCSNYKQRPLESSSNFSHLKQRTEVKKKLFFAYLTIWWGNGRRFHWGQSGSQWSGRTTVAGRRFRWVPLNAQRVTL